MNLLNSEMENLNGTRGYTHAYFIGSEESPVMINLHHRMRRSLSHRLFSLNIAL